MLSTIVVCIERVRLETIALSSKRPRLAEGDDLGSR